MCVFIKGFSMPETCEYCPCNNDGVGCGATGYIFSYADLYVKRMDDCPLVEIPVPHGQIIDVETIEEIRFHDADGFHVISGEQLYELEIDAKTIIEAEGE